VECASRSGLVSIRPSAVRPRGTGGIRRDDDAERALKASHFLARRKRGQPFPPPQVSLSERLGRERDVHHQRPEVGPVAERVEGRSDPIRSFRPRTNEWDKWDK
jgi:hypothetical protein